MLDISDKLIVALDVDSFDRAKYFVDILYPTVKLFKIGSQLFTACGPAAVDMVYRKGGRVFLDLKWLDIPRTVYSAVVSGTSLASEQAVFMMSVHTRGGKKMLQEAVKGATERARELDIKKPYLVGVTSLTSEEQTKDTEKEVLDAARLTKESGLDGVVCSAREAKAVRSEFGKGFLIVTPGIRPHSAKPDDQKRTATAKEALEAGSDFLVVGRPILQAENPFAVTKEMLRELQLDM